MNKKEFSN